MAPRDDKPSVQFVDAPNLADPEFYSHAVSINNGSRLIHTSGHIGNYKDGQFPVGFKAQAEQAFKNLGEALNAAGVGVRDIVKITFYCVGWKATETPLIEAALAFITDEYGTQFRPLTTLVPVPMLAHPEALFEVEAVAAVPGRARPWTTGSNLVAKIAPPLKVDVIVIGGGFSGLQAANDVHKAGLSCMVLEAKHRVGGRSRSAPLASGPGIIELGATWINDKTQPKIYALSQRFGLALKEQYFEGHAVLQDSDGKIHISPAGQLVADSIAPNDAMEVNKVMTLLEESMPLVDIRNPTIFPPELDVSVDEFLKMHKIKGFASDMMAHLVRALVGREMNEVGIHYLLDYMKSGRGFASLSSEGPEGAQYLKFKKGTSSIAEGLASELKPGSVMLNSPVDTISQYNKFVIVKTANGATIQATKAIIAIPTNTYSKIHFCPPLPAEKRTVVSHTNPGKYAKAILTYRKPWWKEIGLLGAFTSFNGPICFSWDISDDETQQYSLAIFVAGERARKWHELSSLQREETLLAHLVELVGLEHAHLVHGILEFNVVEWTKEEWIEGAPTSAMGPGALVKGGKALREPFLNLHFAGGETSFEWKGYLEGALLAGSRAADEVIERTKSRANL